jgi:V/A-type H+/Na+-transporting ATPase subunit I
MSIVPVEKVVLFGPTGDKERVLEELQDLGCVHLIPLQLAERASGTPGPSDEPQRRALRYLLDAPTKRRQSTEDAGFEMAAIVEAALANAERKREIEDRIDALTARIRVVEPWGDFAFPPVEALGRQRLWFYRVPHYQLRKMMPGDIPWHIVNRDANYAYVVLLSPDMPPPATMPVPRSRLGKRSLSELRRELGQAETELEEVVAERWALTRWIALMIRNLARAEDRAALKKASSSALDRDGIVAVAGWVARRDMEEMEALARSNGLALLATPPADDEAPPVLLDNTPAFEPGEDLVGFYQIPGYRDWDPSAVMYASFAVFFGMILADAGYGALLVVATLILWRRLGATPSGVRGRKLLAAVAVASVAYGVVVGSYFGTAPPVGSLWARLAILDLHHFGTMMRLALGIGVAHLALANGVTAWVRRRSWTALAPVGWMTALAGGYAAYLGWRGGVWILASGLMLVLLFSSSRPVRRPSDVSWRLLHGLQALTGVSKAFGDSLSYLRLFALGLSSASLALTFNELGTEILGRGSGIPVLLGLLVLTLGHGLNFLLGIVGGVVHGLRLNVIELYSWSIFGEGTPFRAFRRQERST